MSASIKSTPDLKDQPYTSPFACFQNVQTWRVKIMPYREVLVHGVLPFEEFPIQSICCNIQGLNSPKLLYIHPNPINIHTLYPYDHIHLLHVSQDNSGQQQTQTETNRHQMTPTDGTRHPKRLFKDAWRLLLTLNGICWCLLVSDDVF